MKALKTSRSEIQQITRGVSFCGRTSAIEIGGRKLRPDADKAYVEFKLGHAFPVTTKYRTAIHPQVLANSYDSMEDKVFNLGHIMRKYDKKNNPRDRMLGTIVAVEFPEEPEGGWTVQADREMAPGIRACAVMHKAAQDVDEIITTWANGTTIFNPDSEWTVSMENSHRLENSGFIVRGTNGLATFVEDTPADLLALGYTYVPCMTAPDALLDCLNNDDDDIRDEITSTRICRNFLKQDTILLLNGLDGTIRFQGVGLCPVGMEPEAHVKTMLAAEKMFDLSNVLEAFDDFTKKISR
jgi:hypothetical protein